MQDARKSDPTECVHQLLGGRGSAKVNGELAQRGNVLPALCLGLLALAVTAPLPLNPPPRCGVAIRPQDPPLRDREPIGGQDLLHPRPRDPELKANLL